MVNKEILDSLLKSWQPAKHVSKSENLRPVSDDERLILERCRDAMETRDSDRPV